MKNIRIFLSENIPFLVVKFSIHLNRSVFVMFTNRLQLVTVPLPDYVQPVSVNLRNSLSMAFHELQTSTENI